VGRTESISYALNNPVHYLDPSGLLFGTYDVTLALEKGLRLPQEVRKIRQVLAREGNLGFGVGLPLPGAAMSGTDSPARMVVLSGGSPRYHVSVAGASKRHPKRCIHGIDARELGGGLDMSAGINSLIYFPATLTGCPSLQPQLLPSSSQIFTTNYIVISQDPNIRPVTRFRNR